MNASELVLFEGTLHMDDYLSPDDGGLLRKHGLDQFDALWALKLDTVDELNHHHGGWSGVSKLALDGRNYFLKRQEGYVTRSVTRLRSEPTFVKEFTNLQKLARCGVPTMEVAFFGCRPAGKRAILMTRALDGEWQSLAAIGATYRELPPERRIGMMRAVGGVIRQLHAHRLMHGCIYPVHLFLAPDGADGCRARLIDLEKVRPFLVAGRDRLKDIEPLLRRSQAFLGDEDARLLLAAYFELPPGHPKVAAYLRKIRRWSRRKKS